MIKRSTNILAAIIVVLALVVDVFAGGGKRNGTGGAQELLIPVGARGLAMSGAYLSGIEGVDAIFYNPAGLSFSDKSAEAMFSYMNYFADIGFAYAAVAVHFDEFGSIAFHVRSLDFGNIPVTTVENPYGDGSTFSPTYVVVGLAYSNSLTDRIRVGFNINIINEEIGRTNASGIGFDAGVQYNGLAGIEGLKFGIALRNLGPQMSFDGPDLLRNATEVDGNRGVQPYKIDAAPFELPSQLELGLAYETRFADDYKALIAGSFENNNFSNDEYRFAGEFSYDDIIFLRGGYSYQSEGVNVEEENVFGPTFGAGINVKGSLGITVDYAYRSATFFSANHMVSVKLGF